MNGATGWTRRVPPGERTARIAWARLVEPADAGAVRLVETLGPEEALRGLDPASPLGTRIAPRLATLDVERDLEIAGRLGARVIIPDDPEWPQGLRSLTAPPWCLWVRGPVQLADVCERSVSIVGARAATGYGVHQARELAAGLVDRDFMVVSGAAYGIDGAAHQGALAGDGLTVAVVAGGIDRPYPAGHASLLARIAESGAVLTEVPPGSAPTRWRFLSRNRVIATLSQGTVVVEAGLRSGSRNTANQAREHQRVVCAVPGPVTSAASAGCHELLREEGVILVTDADEIVEAVGQIGELASPKRGRSSPQDALSELQQVVYAALPVSATASVDQLAQRSGRSTGEVRSSLGILSAGGLCERRDDGWRKRRTS
ncbi:DNA-processing protein DprA [Pedococcus sp. 5OH_020]|uniref:DNA-processing protein DprA n=1 Tax=Pedococcus sp. 5OH_020 TaxID=2989814 RepID=UPI0022EA0098|nr:DNA-processing protein DprA [Pedococcus sp. 5OH_020]